jgi:hypothetical protein
MWTVYLKEMLELLRDRKTFIFTVLVPIVAMPLIFAGFGWLTSAMFKRSELADLPYSVGPTRPSWRPGLPVNRALPKWRWPAKRRSRRPSTTSASSSRW